MNRSLYRSFLSKRQTISRQQAGSINENGINVVSLRRVENKPKPVALQKHLKSLIEFSNTRKRDERCLLLELPNQFASLLSSLFQDNYEA
mmetsp:Transcript_22178/g.65742  ORF Transcript_22178/g.65742 Transcript_22178/m.65742 type:complete len:90 (+) Transcript_22178:135-404(+)